MQMNEKTQDASPFYWYQKRKRKMNYDRDGKTDEIRMISKQYEFSSLPSKIDVAEKNAVVFFSFSTAHWWCAYVYSISECIIEKTISTIGGKIVSIVPENWRKREGCSIGKFGKVSQNRSLLENLCVFICLNVPSTSQSIRSQKA